MLQIKNIIVWHKIAAVVLFTSLALSANGNGSLISAQDLLNLPQWLELARQEILEELLQSIHNAAMNGDWNQVQKLASEIQIYDQPTARRWNALAEAHLTPSVKITAWIDDREVNAVLLHHEDLKTPLHITNLIPNAQYTGDLLYTYNGENYLAKIDFKTDWQGLRELKIPLEPAIRVMSIPLPGNAPSIQLVKIQAASFLMGTANGSSNERLHSVNITQDYWISKHEITQRQWMAVMKSNPSNYKSDNHPVESITWNDAMAFCEQVNLLAAYDLPTDYKASLPTEAQWEYAARGGKFNQNHLYSGSENLDDVAWYAANAGIHTQPVGLKQPNELGLYDMTGNVWEWCLDRCQWDKKVITDTYADNVTDPLSTMGDLHILRGGGWLSSPPNCRIAKRLCGDANFKIHNLGLRIVLIPTK